MLSKLYSFLDKKTKLQILLIQLVFIISTFLEFLNLNFLLAFLISIFSKDKLQNSIPFFDYFNFEIISALSSSEIGILLLVIFFCSSLFILLSNYVIFYFSHYLKAKLTNTYFLRTLNANYFYILNKGASGVIHDVTNEIPKISDGVILPILMIFNKLFLMSAILIFLLTNFFDITLKLLAISFFMILIFYLILKKYFYDFGVKVSFSQNNVIKSLHETFSNLQAIKIFNLEKYFVEKVFQNLKIFTKYQSLGYLFGSIPKFFFELFAISIVTFVLIYFSYNEDTKIEFLIPTIGTFAFVGYRLLPIFQEIFNSLSMVKNSQYASNKILNKYLFKNTNLKLNNKRIIESAINKIEIYNLNFKYPGNRSFIFKNFSISFFKNKITTITGNSGAGKTTLVNIINGLIIPQNINFKINGKKVDNQEYYEIIKNKFSYNDQRPNLFDVSIKKNVALNFNTKSYNERLFLNSLKKASLSELNTKSRKGSSVGSSGVKLSGGQIQRLLIARALYHQKDVLIFDEPTNFLDEKNKDKVIESIKQIKKNKIVIILSHDEKILKISDKVFKI